MGRRPNTRTRTRTRTRGEGNGRVVDARVFGFDAQSSVSRVIVRGYLPCEVVNEE